jgi:FkbM family methyltransferase
VGASTVSIEPVPETFALLQRNIRVNNVEHLVTANNCAVGKRADELRISIDRGPQNSIVAPDYSGRAAQVPVQPLDALLNGQATALWKVDVEGFELEVLEGARQSIADPALWAVILESDSTSIRRLMQSHGFQLFAYNPRMRELTALNSNQHVTGNHLWIRNPEHTMTRCRQGPKYTILSTSV